jgi:hypothetical protein
MSGAIDIARQPTPPVRQSVHANDFDSLIGSQTEVLLDGVPQSTVISYDCEAGTVQRYQTNAEGQVMLDSAWETMLEETLTGTVTVRWKAGQ